MGQYMDRSMRRDSLEMREPFHIDGYYDASLDFDEMPRQLNGLEAYIDQIEGIWPQRIRLIPSSLLCRLNPAGN